MIHLLYDYLQENENKQKKSKTHTHLSDDYQKI